MKLPAAAGLLALAAAAAGIAWASDAERPDPRRSGFDDMGASTQALQRDDTQNPAMLWVQEGEQRYAADCARCHASDRMRGVAARYPAWDAEAGKPVTLAGRINLCRQRHMKAAPWAPESQPLLSLEAYVAYQSRGQPVAPDPDPRLQPAREQGGRLFQQRFGQLQFSCAQCHDESAGRRLAGNVIPQGHPTAYPLYRLEWQGMGSLQRRLRNCMSGVRAEPYAYGSDEATALELYLKQRAAGMTVESPGVRP